MTTQKPALRNLDEVWSDLEPMLRERHSWVQVMPQTGYDDILVTVTRYNAEAHRTERMIGAGGSSPSLADAFGQVVAALRDPDRRIDYLPVDDYAS